MALLAAEKWFPDVVLTDLRMDQVDGFDVLAGVRALDPTLPVIIMTGFGAIDSAIEAIKRGAYHYLTKPFRLEEVLLCVGRALADRQLRDQHRAFSRTLRSSLSGTMRQRPTWSRARVSRLGRPDPCQVG